MSQLSDRHQKMMDTAGFYEVFLRELSNYRTQKECYRAIADEYKQVFGIEPYASFESFKVTNWKRLNRSHLTDE